MTPTFHKPASLAGADTFADVAVLIVALLVFALAVAWHIELPGLYMDAVNPDYLSVDVLHGTRATAPIWVLPGNVLVHRLPILTSLYHGTGHVWLALPFVAVFGPTIATLRATQALTGAAILVLTFLLLRRERPAPVPQLLVGLPVLALALDPVFVYAYRTQLYIQLAPVAWLLAALLAGERAWQTRYGQARFAPRWLLLAGLFYGLSIYGYFIFIFFAPVLALANWFAWRQARAQASQPSLLRVLAWLAAGLMLGVSGYLLGYFLIFISEHGLHGFVQFFADYQRSLGAFETHRTLVPTISYFADLIWRVFSNDWQHSLMFGDAWAEPSSAIKLILLLAMPLAFCILLELRGRSTSRLRLVVAMLTCFPLVALIFGDRLSGHHFVVLLPLAYLALGLALARSITPDSGSATASRIGATTVWLALVVINLAGLQATGAELLRTHGRGLFSDAINSLAADAVTRSAKDPNTIYYFPDWGLFMPFHYLTGGAIPHWTDIEPVRMRSELCRGHNLRVALINGDVTDRFGQVATLLRWSAPHLQTYRSHENLSVFTIGEFDAAAAPPGSDCTTSP